MAALATDTVRAIKGAKVYSFKIANASQLYVGSFVSLLAGYAQPFAGAAGEQLVGRCLPTPNPLLTAQLLGNTSSSPVPEANVCLEDEVLIQVAVTGAAAITDVGAIVYLNSTDNDLTKTRPARGVPFGIIVRWYTSTTCDVLRYGKVALDAIALGGNGSDAKIISINLPDYTTATDYQIVTPPYAWKLRSTSFTVTVAPTGAAGVTTFQPKIGSVAVTGGLVTVSTGDATAAIDAGTAVTAANTGSESSVLKLTVTKTGTVTTGAGLLTLIFDRQLGL